MERFGPEEMEVGEFGCGRELLFLVRSKLFGNLYFWGKPLFAYNSLLTVLDCSGILK